MRSILTNTSLLSFVLIQKKGDKEKIKGKHKLARRVYFVIIDLARRDESSASGGRSTSARAYELVGTGSSLRQVCLPFSVIGNTDGQTHV